MECKSRLPYSINSCSGNGYVCVVPDIGCICNNGWTSAGDYSLDDSNCLINHKAVRIISYFCFLIAWICNFFIIRHYIKLGMRKRSCYVITWEYKTIFPFWFLIMGISCANLGILKVAYPDDKQPLVGQDLSASLTVLFSESSFFFGFFCYLHVIMAFLEGYSRMMTSESRLRMSQRFHLLDSTAWIIPPTVVIISMLQLISIRYPRQSKKLGATRLVVVGAMIILSGWILCAALSFLLKELNGVTLSKDLKLIITRLNIAYYFIAASCLPFGILYIAFASSTYLFQLNTYLILVTYTCVPPIMLALVVTVSGISRPESKQIVPTTSSKKSTPAEPYDLPGVSPASPSDGSDQKGLQTNGFQTSSNGESRITEQKERVNTTTA